jgi:hypothetical protein
MMVAVAGWPSPPPQHSPIFGQRASSHTVCSFFERSCDLILLKIEDCHQSGIEENFGLKKFEPEIFSLRDGPLEPRGQMQALVLSFFSFQFSSVLDEVSETRTLGEFLADFIWQAFTAAQSCLWIDLLSIYMSQLVNRLTNGARIKG